MNQTSRRLGIVITLVTLLAAACGSSGGSGGAGGSTGGGGGNGSGGSTGACAARPDLVAAAPTCDNVVNAAAAIPFTALGATAPAPTGGTIVDGLYEATKTGTYGATTGTGRRVTFVITGGGKQMLWAGEVLDGTGTTVQASFRADATIAAAGTQIQITVNCVSTPVLPAAFDYTVSGADLVLSLATGGTTAATTYTRRGCAP